MLSIQELRSSTVKELHQELAAARNNLLKFRISTRTKHEKNTAKVGQAKAYVARILTALREAEAEAEKKPVAKPEDKESKTQ